MQKDTIIYVTDQRQKYLADMLNGEKESCHGDKIRDYARVGNIIFLGLLYMGMIHAYQKPDTF